MHATSFQRWAYRSLAKPFFFQRDPERVHDAVSIVGNWAGRLRLVRVVLSTAWSFSHPALEQQILGIRFKNPVGLTAGFDKDGVLTEIIPSVGFGFEEIGSVTGEPCQGNPKPRLWRLPQTRGLIVHYGLKNEGAARVAARLKGRRFHIPIGTSVAKTNSRATIEPDAGIADYEKAFRAFAEIGDYFAVNISCPNTFGGEPFAQPERLDALLTRLDAVPTRKPIFLKIAVDLLPTELDRIVEVMDRHRVHGVILSNLTKKRDRVEIRQDELVGKGEGGISGIPTRGASNALIAHMYKHAGDRYAIIGVGGIFSAEDAYAKIRAGASLVELATGMIFEGPQLIGEINKGLVSLLAKDGYASVSEAIGADVRKEEKTASV